MGQWLGVAAALTLVFAVVWKRTHAVDVSPRPVVRPLAEPQAARTAEPGATGPMPAGAEAQALRNMPMPTQAEIRPVYPTVLTGEPEPLAKAYCSAIHELQAQKRAACCAGRPGVVLTADCTRIVTYALRNKAVMLTTEAVEQCAAAMRDSLQDCGWVGFLQPPLPAACITAIQGTLPAGARCRSSLECGGALRCQGVGPTELGTCGAPLPAGQRCAASVDALAAFTRYDQLDRRHPECQGFCGRTHLCENPLQPGSDCVMSAQCGTGNRCGGGKCVAGSFGQLDEPCVGGDCVPGLRCVKLQCKKPGPTGTACTNDFDCRGGCLRKPGANPNAPGECGPRCL